MQLQVRMQTGFGIQLYKVREKDNDGMKDYI